MFNVKKINLSPISQNNIYIIKGKAEDQCVRF